MIKLQRRASLTSSAQPQSPHPPPTPHTPKKIATSNQQPEVKPGCVLRRSNFSVLEREKLVTDKQVDQCKKRMNTFGFVGDLSGDPQVGWCGGMGVGGGWVGGWVGVGRRARVVGCIWGRGTLHPLTLHSTLRSPTQPTTLNRPTRSPGVLRLPLRGGREPVPDGQQRPGQGGAVWGQQARRAGGVWRQGGGRGSRVIACGLWDLI